MHACMLKRIEATFSGQNLSTKGIPFDYYVSAHVDHGLLLSHVFTVRHTHDDDDDDDIEDDDDDDDKREQKNSEPSND